MSLRRRGAGDPVNVDSFRFLRFGGLPPRERFGLERRPATEGLSPRGVPTVSGQGCGEPFRKQGPPWSPYERADKEHGTRGFRISFTPREGEPPRPRGTRTPNLLWSQAGPGRSPSLAAAAAGIGTPD